MVRTRGNAYRNNMYKRSPLTPQLNVLPPVPFYGRPRRVLDGNAYVEFHQLKKENMEKVW